MKSKDVHGGTRLCGGSECTHNVFERFRRVDEGDEGGKSKEKSDKNRVVGLFEIILFTSIQ